MVSCAALGLPDGFYMFSGYACASRKERNLGLQHDALRSAGCEWLSDDSAGGARMERSGLNRALEQFRDGGSLIVRWLDRLGRSLKDPIARAEELMALSLPAKFGNRCPADESVMSWNGVGHTVQCGPCTGYGKIPAASHSTPEKLSACIECFQRQGHGGI